MEASLAAPVNVIIPDVLFPDNVLVVNVPVIVMADPELFDMVLVETAALKENPVSAELPVNVVAVIVVVIEMPMATASVQVLSAMVTGALADPTVENKILAQ